MKLRGLILSVLGAVSFFGYGQYTDVINSNNPGKSMGAYSVGRKVVQVESEFFMDKEKHAGMGLEQSSYGVNYEVRYGELFERLEFVLDGTFMGDRMEGKDFVQKSTGFYENTLGAKFLIYEPRWFSDGPSYTSWEENATFKWRKLLPAVSLYGGANFFPKDRYLHEVLNENSHIITPKAILCLQAHPARDVVLIGNVVWNRFNEWSYIISLTHNLYKARWSIFLENEGVLAKSYYNDTLLRAGTSCLITEDLMLNAWGGLSIKTTPSKYAFALGVSYRLLDNHHKIEYKEKMEARKRENAEDARIFHFDEE